MKKTKITLPPFKKHLQGSFSIPGDKSISHRAILLGALAQGKSYLKNCLMSSDCLNTIQCCKDMGISFSEGGDSLLTIEGKGLYGLRKPLKPLFVGNSGTSIRLLSGILSAQSFSSTIYGDQSIARRPMGRIVNPLSQMGAFIQTNDGFPPLSFEPSMLQGIVYSSPISSAQVKSALLLAGLYSSGKTILKEPTLSRNHTELMLAHQGVPIEIEESCCRVTIQKYTDQLKPLNIVIPGDISSALFFIVAALIRKGSEITLKNIGLNPTRRAVIDLLRKIGAHIEITNRRNDVEPVGDIIVKYSRLKSIDLNGEHISKMIDEIPILAVALSQANGISRISDAQELRVKESDRIKGIVQMISNLGGKISENSDGFTIEGQHSLKGGIVDSGGDHRIAMSTAIASLCCQNEVSIEGTDCISTSFPSFFEIFFTLLGEKFHG